MSCGPSRGQPGTPLRSKSACGLLQTGVDRVDNTRGASTMRRGRRRAAVRLGSSTRWGSRDAVLVASRVLAVLFAALVPVHVLVLDGTPRLVMTGLAAVTATAFHII